jgi:predicted nucleotidyltransferase component of viral defense system
MQDLIKQEQFELEVLEKLNSKRLLGQMVFGGGTMLRLCFGLNRFSVDLDFWLVKKINIDKLFREIKDYLASLYKITDSANKLNTLLFEIKSKDYPRSLIIEIRKETKNITVEQAIAYSKYSNTQVFLQVVSPKDMMAAKIGAFLDRKEIKDAFDIEFLLKKGLILDAPLQTLTSLLKGIEALTKKDYTVKLGSIVEAQERQYYSRENFKILKSAIMERLGRHE